MILVTWSRVRAWRRCHCLYHYKYIEGLTPIKPKTQLFQGSLLHELLDAEATCKSAKGVLRKYREKYARLDPSYSDLIEETRQIFENYQAHYRNGEKLTPLVSEYKVRVKISDDMIYRGYIDKIVESEDGLWLLDHKSHKRFPDANDQMHDLQLVLYCWAWQQQEEIRPLIGIIWDYIRTKLPSVPNTLVRGGLSKAAIDTTSEVYLGEIRRQNLKVEDYVDILKKLSDNANPFFERRKLPLPTQAMMHNTVKDLIATGHELSSRDKTRNLNRDCSWCDFKTLCQAEFRGHNADEIRTTDFTQRTDADYLEERANDNQD